MFAKGLVRGNLKTFLIFDTETSGLILKKRDASYSHVPHLVQLAWILIDENKNILEEQNFIVKPQGFVISKEVSRIHGITHQMALNKGVDLLEVLSVFSQTLEENKPTLIAHNLDFDHLVIRAELWRSKITDKTFVSLDKICTMKISTEHCALPSKNPKRKYKWPSLQELHQKLLAKELTNAHNALVDVKACLKCFLELLRLGVI
jgi:DNA polymerase III subunit epsilon